MADDKTPEAEIISPFAKDKKTPKRSGPTKLRSTHVSTMPPAQNLFGRLIQTMNEANTQNVKSTNPGWDIYAAAERAVGNLEKIAAFASPSTQLPSWMTTGPTNPVYNPMGTLTSIPPDIMRQLMERLFSGARTPTSGKLPAGALDMKTAEGKVEKVMGKFKDKKPRSGRKDGPVVKSRDQAIAIALSEAREAGEDVPAKKSEVRTMKLSDLEKAAKITAARRKSLPKSDFGLKGKADTKKEKAESGNYPIDTEGRARAALAYSKRFASPSQQATIRQRVKSKYPKMEVSAEDSYWDGVFEKLAAAGVDEKQAQAFLERLGDIGMAAPRAVGRLPGWMLGLGMVNPMTMPLASMGVLGRMLPKRPPTMGQRLRRRAGDVSDYLRGLF